jgi:uncharacterized protein (DUF2236 family)
MAAQRAGTRPDLDVRDLVSGAGMLAATANVIMQLARPEVGYGVLESRVEGAQLMRHPLRRMRTTFTYLSVALTGTPADREMFRQLVNRSHLRVRSTALSPVRYNAFDPRLQLWVAACLYQGVRDVHALLHGPADDSTADAIYRESSRLGTTLQVPGDMWPADRAAFERYWAAAVAEIRIDPAVRGYLRRVMRLDFLPWPLRAALGPLNEFVTTGFLPQPFRDQMQLRWRRRDQRLFGLLMRATTAVNRLLPAPVRRFPFNACLRDLRIRARWDPGYRAAASG